LSVKSVHSCDLLRRAKGKEEMLEEINSIVNDDIKKIFFTSFVIK